MLRKLAPAVALMLGTATTAWGQATGTPSFNAPYRAFVRHEVGGTISFPEGGGTALEGQYRFGYRAFDIGLRGGIFFPSGAADDRFLVGAEGRGRVLTHTEQFPLDGALVVGAGFNFNGGTVFAAPVGLSLGRRLTIEDSQISIVPYVQPTGFLTNSPGIGGRDTDFLFAVGLGADFRLSQVFDARISVGLGDVEGVSISAVWVR